MTIPREVTAAWGWDGAAIATLSGGLINATFVVREAADDARPVAVLQRLHPVFGATVNLDLEAVTTHLATKGLATPRLIRTRAGAAWIEHGGQVWRALTWVDGETVHVVPAPAWAEAGGALVGQFHVAVADLEHRYAFARAGVHDTARHLARLAEAVAGEGAPAWIALGAAILEAAGDLPEMPDTPPRHCHGDLKISNLLFERGAPRGVCLLDLDTLGRSTIAFELGDAMRSWCNPRGEDGEQVELDLDIFAAAMRGFCGVADGLMSVAERRSIVVGMETVCLELAARFAVDVFRDDYFGWDPGRFASRRAHNLVRAERQLALGRAVARVRADALAIVEDAGA